jgi:hypothetical protein
MFACKAAGCGFHGIQEDLLRTMDIVKKSGTGIAFPSRNTYLPKTNRSTPKNQLKFRRADSDKKQLRTMTFIPTAEVIRSMCIIWILSSIA